MPPHVLGSSLDKGACEGGYWWMGNYWLHSQRGTYAWPTWRCNGRSAAAFIGDRDPLAGVGAAREGRGAALAGDGRAHALHDSRGRCAAAFPRCGVDAIGLEGSAPAAMGGGERAKGRCSVSSLRSEGKGTTLASVEASLCGSAAAARGVRRHLGEREAHASPHGLVTRGASIALQQRREANPCVPPPPQPFKFLQS